MRKLSELIYNHSMGIIVLMFLAFFILAQTVGAQEQPQQDLNKMRTEIVLNNKVLIISNTLRNVQNEIDWIVTQAGLAIQLQKKCDSLESELAKVKPKKAEPKK